MLNLKVSRAFTSYTDAGLDEFANGTYLGINNNQAFADAPVKPADLLSVNLVFRNAIAAATGDPTDTATKNAVREDLLDVLRKNASYVEIVASHNLATLLSSGYYPTSTNHAQYPLEPPVIQELSNLATTKLLLRLQPVVGAKTYHAQASADGGKTWLADVFSTQSRRITVPGLTPGTTYVIRVRAIGGSTGCSEWSQTTTIMAT